MNFKVVVKEIQNVAKNMVFFEEVLTGLIVFLVTFVVLAFLKVISPMWAFLVFMIVVIVRISLRSRKNALLEVEEINPDLKEKLRTAADNPLPKSPMTEELHKETVTGLRQVYISAFVDVKNLYLKIFAVILLSFLLMFMVSFDYKGLDAGLIVDAVYPIFIPSGDGECVGPDCDFVGAGFQGPEPELGDIDVATLGDTTIDVTLSRVSYEINVRDVEEAHKRDFDELFPTSIESTNARTYEERLPREQQEIVNSYFKELTN